MAEQQLREKVTQGVAWSMAEKIGSMLLSMAVRLVILRLLTREILGYMAIPTAIVTVLLVLVALINFLATTIAKHMGKAAKGEN